MFDDRLVRFFDIHSSEIFHFLCKPTLGVDWTHQWACVFIDHPIAQTDAIIILAEIRGLMDNTCATLFGHIVIAQDTEGGGNLMEGERTTLTRGSTRRRS